MNIHIINVIIGREYMTRVKKKSFLLTTFLGPVFFAAMCILPSVIMFMTTDKGKEVAVVDQFGHSCHTESVVALNLDTGNTKNLE